MNQINEYPSNSRYYSLNLVKKFKKKSSIFKPKKHSSYCLNENLKKSSKLSN